MIQSNENNTNAAFKFYRDWIVGIMPSITSLGDLTPTMKERIRQELPAKRAASLLLFGHCLYMDICEKYLCITNT